MGDNATYTLTEWADHIADAAAAYSARACWFGWCRGGERLCEKHRTFREGARAGVLRSLGKGDGR